MSASVISGIGELRRCVSPGRLQILSKRALQEENNRQENAKAGNGKVDPLHVAQSLLGLSDVHKDYVGAEYRSNDGANSIEGLRQVDTEFRVARRTADCDVWVRSSLKRSQAIADDENGGTEAAKRPVEDARPGDQSAKRVEAQSPYEHQLVSKVAEDPVGMSQTRQWICAKVRGL